MTLELVKQLKDVRFPLERVPLQLGKVLILERPAAVFDPQPMAVETADVYYIPTLSELIETCGEGFLSLELNPNEDKWRWRANMRGVGVDGTIDSYGKTPEEAVARLWLALNVKG